MKLKLIFILIIFINSYGYSQKLAINIDAGYGLKIASSSYSEGRYSFIDINNGELSLIKYSLGSGLNLNSELEYSPIRFLKFGLGIGYLSSSFSFKHNFGSYIENNRVSAKMIRFSPYLKGKINLDKFNLYFRLGYILGLNGEIILKKDWTSSQGDQSVTKRRFNENLSHGAVSGLGIEYEITTRIFILAEVKLFIQSFGPGKKELFVSTTNGENRLDEIEPRRIHTNYVTSYKSDALAFNDPLKPEVQLIQFYPFSSIGLNLGLSYKIIK